MMPFSFASNRSQNVKVSCDKNRSLFTMIDVLKDLHANDRFGSIRMPDYS
jgi:hypothetical protein